MIGFLGSILVEFLKFIFLNIFNTRKRFLARKILETKFSNILMHNKFRLRVSLKMSLENSFEENVSHFKEN